MDVTTGTLALRRPDAVAASGVRLVVDYGTLVMRALLCWPDGRQTPLLTNSGGIDWPSGVLVGGDGRLVAGRDAVAAAETSPDGPAAFCHDLKSVLTHEKVAVGDHSIEPAAGLAALLARLAAQAQQVAGRPVEHVSITVPAGWGPRHRQVLRAAAETARLPEPDPIPVPVAAAWLLTTSRLAALPAGSTVLICDFGHAAFEASLLVRASNQFAILATARRPTAGGAAIDELLVEHCLTHLASLDPDGAGRLRHPQSAADRRGRQMLEGSVRAVRPQLAAGQPVAVVVPVSDRPVPITVDQFTELTSSIGHTCAQTTAELVDAAGIDPATLTGAYAIGGAITPTALEAIGEHTLQPHPVPQPELVAVYGATHTPVPGQLPPPVPGWQHRWLRGCQLLPALGALGATVFSGLLLGLAIYSSHPLEGLYQEHLPTVPDVHWGEYAMACCCAMLAATATAEALPARLPPPKRPGIVRVPPLAYAAVAGLVACLAYGAIGTTSLHLPWAVGTYLRWALLPALPIAALAALTGLLQLRYPHETGRAGPPGRRRWFPGEATAAAGLGMAMIQFPAWDSDHEWFWAIELGLFGPVDATTWEHTIGRIGSVAIGVGIALAVTTTSRLRILTVPVGAAITSIIPEFDLITGLGVAFVTAASAWWLLRLVRLLAATAPRWRPQLPVLAQLPEPPSAMTTSQDSRPPRHEADVQHVHRGEPVVPHDQPPSSQ